MRTAPSFLVVEDEPTATEHLCSLLRALYGPELAVTTSRDGASAVEHLRQRPFSAILTDHAPADVPGVDLLAIARLEAPGTPRILMTRQPSLDLARDAINRAGVHALLRKPYALPELRDVLAIAQRAAAYRP